MKNPGKAKCEVLKDIRKQIAAANDIDYNTRECTFQGECTGTCPACEQELAYLTEEIRKRKAAGLTVDFEAFKRYKEAENEDIATQDSNTKKKHSALKAAAVAAAAAMGVTALSSCNLFQTNGNMERGRLEGEVPIDTNEVNQVMGEMPRDTTDANVCKEMVNPADSEEIIKLEGDVPRMIKE